MKKKFQLVLPLLTLPLLTSCPPSIEKPFKIDEFDVSNTFTRKIPASGGLDLTIEYGLYCKDLNPGLGFFDRKFMFLVSYEDDPEVWNYWSKSDTWMPLYDITDDVRSCYWIPEGFLHGIIYNKKAKVHFDSEFFVPEHVYISIRLAGVDGYEADKKIYRSSEVEYTLDEVTIFYSVDEESNVTLSDYFTWNRQYSPKNFLSETISYSPSSSPRNSDRRFELSEE